LEILRSKLQTLAIFTFSRAYYCWLLGVFGGRLGAGNQNFLIGFLQIQQMAMEKNSGSRNPQSTRDLVTDRTTWDFFCDFNA